MGYIPNSLLADNYVKVIEQVEDTIERLHNKVLGREEKKTYAVFGIMDVEGRMRTFMFSPRTTKEEKRTLQMVFSRKAQSFIDHKFFDENGNFVVPYMDKNIERKDWGQILGILGDSRMHPSVFRIIFEYVTDESLRNHALQVTLIEFGQVLEKLTALEGRYSQAKDILTALRKAGLLKPNHSHILSDRFNRFQ